MVCTSGSVFSRAYHRLDHAAGITRAIRHHSRSRRGVTMITLPCSQHWRGEQHSISKRHRSKPPTNRGKRNIIPADSVLRRPFSNSSAGNSTTARFILPLGLVTSAMGIDTTGAKCETVLASPDCGTLLTKIETGTWPQAVEVSIRQLCWCCVVLACLWKTLFVLLLLCSCGGWLLLVLALYVEEVLFVSA